MTDETDDEARRKARRAAVDAAWEEYWREEEARVTTRYVKRFGTMPPLMVWDGSCEHLERLMEAALKRGRALTDADLRKAQGYGPPDPDVLYDASA